MLLDSSLRQQSCGCHFLILCIVLGKTHNVEMLESSTLEMLGVLVGLEVVLGEMKICLEIAKVSVGKVNLQG